MIPISRPDLSSLEKKYLNEAFTSSWISSTGEFINRAEKLISNLAGTKYAVVTSNGTTALHLALLVSGVSEGDEVIVPSFTFISSVNAIKFCGATPVFVDISCNTWTLDPDQVEKAITEKTKAILAVNLFGHPYDHEAISLISNKFGLKIIEDNAEAPGAEFNGTKTGGLGDVATFSFYGNKIITAGEGGALTTNDQVFAEKARIFRDHGMNKSRKYHFDVIGFNYRMTNISAAILTAQMERFETMTQKRLNLYDYYSQIMRKTISLKSQPIAKWAKISPWLYPVLCESADMRDDLMQKLKNRGIETRPFFYPVHKQRAYAEFNSHKLVNTDEISSRGLLLPTSSSFNEEELRYLVSTISEIFQSK